MIRVTQHTYTKKQRVLKGGRKAPFLLTTEKTHEPTIPGQQGQELETVPAEHRQDEGDQHRSASDTRRRTTLKPWPATIQGQADKAQRAR